jgi:hypothetical protein
MRGFESADPINDATYLRRLQATSGSSIFSNNSTEIGVNIVVYLSISNLPDFLPLFQSLPQTARIILVSGLEDIGTPWEAWGFGRQDHFAHALWSNSKNTVESLRSFILDKRLVHWYAQNYDLVGCTSFYCSKINDTDKDVVKKVSAIPIGVDFHTPFKASISSSERDRPLEKREICRQQSELTSIRDTLAPFLNRPLRVSVEFSCDPDDSKPSRTELCRHLVAEKHPDIDTTPKGNRNAFWSSLGSYAFSFAPPGRGQDTHRFWEILQMGSVPIVVSSPLDKLYSKFPVLIVKKWSVLFPKNSSSSSTMIPKTAQGDSHLVRLLKRSRERLVKRFGNEPFKNPKVVSMLASEYWINHIRKLAAV